MPFVHALNPVIFKIGPFSFRWYGFMWVLGFLFTYFYGKKVLSQKGILSNELFEKLSLWALIGTVTGGRIGYVIFYNLPYYLSNPLKVFAVWEGGMSFHGGLIGIILAGFLFCKVEKKSFLEIADVIVVPIALANAFVRIGNFINGELYGGPTALPWGVQFRNEIDSLGNPVYRHPTQIYEAGYDVLIFILLFILRNKEMGKGARVGIFFLLYSIFRSLVELIRIPEITIGPLTMGQFLNIPVFIAGLALFFMALKRKPSLR